MIDRLAVLVATGDLTARLLLPGAAQLAAAGRLPDGFRLVGAAREDWDDHRFRRHAAQRLEEHAGEVPVSVRESLVQRLSYRRADVTDADAVRAVLGDDRAESPVAAYLALPTGLMPATVSAVAGAGLPDGSRIAIEKPFGEDLAGARELNELLAEVLGDGWEQVVFRVDHALGMPTVQGLPGLRFGNRVLEQLWNSEHVEEMQVLWEETLALEDRASFYDKSGALKDVMQNHMMQVLCMAGMESPDSGTAGLGARKVEFLRAVVELSPDDVLAGTGGPGTRRDGSPTPAARTVASCPTTPMRTASMKVGRPRRSPKWCCGSTTRGGPGHGSGCAPARRSPDAARESWSGSARPAPVLSATSCGSGLTDRTTSGSSFLQCRHSAQFGRTAADVRPLAVRPRAARPAAGRE